MKTFFPSITAGVVAVLVGFTSTVALVTLAATSSGADPAQTSSWIMALCLGSGLISLIFSLYYKIPILAAWSTPGAALLATASGGYTLNEMIGAFIFSGALITLSGVTGVFEKILDRIPVSLASAMLVGILLRFGLEVFVSLKTQTTLVMGMFLVYLFSKRLIPRYAIILVFSFGLGVSSFLGLFHTQEMVMQFSSLEFVTPHWNANTLLSIGLPLFVVTMASQNLPGVMTIKSFGYQPRVSSIMTGSGILTILLAPFGGFALNLAAITAAICLGPEANEDSLKRYWASASAGVVYLIVALFGATVTGIMVNLPKELILSIAGIALFGTIGNGLAIALKEERERESALITFLVTASGVTLFGIGSAFWGLILGIVSQLILRSFKKHQ